MEDFPSLISGAQIQYPVRRNWGAQTKKAAFWGGGSQTYLITKASPLSWSLKYIGLTEVEASRFSQFCDKHVATQEYFTFRDPVSDLMHESCMVVPESVVVEARGVNRYEFTVTIAQVQE